MKRPKLYLPHSCTLIGGLWAICWAMMYRQDEFDRTRVNLNHSVPLLLVGLGVGYCVGWLLRCLVEVWPRVSRFLAAVLATVLAGSIAAPFGWLARDQQVDWSGAEAITRVATWGAGVGFVLFVVVWIVSFLRKPAPMSGSPK